MKSIKILLSLCLAMLLCVGANAQVVGGINRDTVNASETVYFYPYDAASDTLSVDFGKGNLYIQMRSDSLSGSTNALNEIQFAGNGPTYDWVTQASGSLTSNGAASQTLIFEDAVFGARKWRIKSVGTGTQATKITTTWVFKRE